MHELRSKWAWQESLQVVRIDTIIYEDTTINDAFHGGNMHVLPHSLEPRERSNATHPFHQIIADERMIKPTPGPPPGQDRYHDGVNCLQRQTHNRMVYNDWDSTVLCKCLRTSVCALEKRLYNKRECLPTFGKAGQNALLGILEPQERKTATRGIAGAATPQTSSHVRVGLRDHSIPQA